MNTSLICLILAFTLLLPATLGKSSVKIKPLESGLHLTRTDSVHLVAAYWRLIIIIQPPMAYRNYTFSGQVAEIQRYLHDVCYVTPYCDGGVASHLEWRLAAVRDLLQIESIKQGFEKRKKRGLFNVGGWLLGKLFGVATNKDLHKLKELVMKGYEQRQVIAHKVNELTSFYNQLAREENITRQVLSDHENSLILLRRELNASRAVDNEQNNRISANYKMILVAELVSLIERRQQLLQNQIDRYREQRMALEAGRLTESVLPRSDLQQILVQAEKKGYDAAPMEWYYEHCLVRPVWETSEGLSFIVELPMFTESVTGYHLDAHPTLQVDTGNWVTLVTQEYVGYNEQNGEIVKLRGCHGHYPTLCEADLIYRTGLPCERSIITGSSSGISKCNVRIQTPKETVIHSVGINQHLITTLDGILETRCQGEPTVHHNVTPGTLLVQFNANDCQIQGSSGWILDSVDVVQEKLKLQDSFELNLSPLKLPVIPPVKELPVEAQHQLHQVEGISLEKLKPLEPLTWTLNDSHETKNSFAIIGISGFILLFLGTIAILFMRNHKTGIACIKRIGRMTCCARCSKEKEELDSKESLALRNISHRQQQQVVPPLNPEIPATLSELGNRYLNSANPILPAYAPTYGRSWSTDNNVGSVETTRF